MFSARTTAEGLAILNRIRAEQKVGWDALIIGAVNAHYGAEVPMPPRTGPTLEERAKARAERGAEKARKAKEREETKAKRATGMKVAKKANSKALEGKIDCNEDTDGNTVNFTQRQD